MSVSTTERSRHRVVVMLDALVMRLDSGETSLTNTITLVIYTLDCTRTYIFVIHHNTTTGKYNISYKVYNISYKVYNISYKVYNISYKVYNISYKVYNISYKVYNISYNRYYFECYFQIS